MMEAVLTLVARIGGAVVVGGVIGIERSLHARPAGFRTHMLVALASAVLMHLTTYQGEWFHALPTEAIRADPARMVQAIMGGIGFLGGGVIFKEGMNVHGLTTAASLWITAALGIVVGVGFYLPAFIGALVTLLVLTAFRRIEEWLPSEYFATHSLTFAPGVLISTADVRALLARHAFTLVSVAHHQHGSAHRYDMVIRTRDRGAGERLARELRAMPDVAEFTIVPSGD